MCSLMRVSSMVGRDTVGIARTAYTLRFYTGEVKKAGGSFDKKEVAEETKFIRQREAEDKERLDEEIKDIKKNHPEFKK